MSACYSDLQEIHSKLVKLLNDMRESDDSRFNIKELDNILKDLNKNLNKWRNLTILTQGGKKSKKLKRSKKIKVEKLDYKKSKNTRKKNTRKTK